MYRIYTNLERWISHLFEMTFDEKPGPVTTD